VEKYEDPDGREPKEAVEAQEFFGVFFASGEPAVVDGSRC
jgi:hypothetical protein